MNKKFSILIFIWTILILSLFLINIYIFNSSLNLTIKLQASAFFEQIEISREWNAKHGGVYAKITDSNQPNKYLKVKNRDIKIDSLNINITKINPAYMTRQIAEIAETRDGLKFHITSLNPLRKENKADEWENKELIHFENDKKIEAFSLEEYLGKPYYRYMKPLYVKQACLKCHQQQGYNLGDIRGGISVSIPAEANLSKKTKTILKYGLIYLVIYLFGLFGLILFKQNIIRLYNTIKKQNSKIKKDTQKIEAILSNANDAIFLINDKEFIDCNKATLKLFQCEFEDIIGHSLSKFSPKYQNNKKLSSIEFNKYFTKVVEGEPQSFDWVHCTKNGDNFYASVSLSKLDIDNEISLIAIVRDITKERLHKQELEEINVSLEESQEEIQQKNEELISLNDKTNEQNKIVQEQKKLLEKQKQKALEASKYKSLFLANMSHEIRTPLNGIIGMTEILKESNLDETQKQNLDVITISGNNLLYIINDILDYSKIEANQLELENVTFDIYNEVETVIKMLNLKAQSKGLELSCSIHPDTPRYLKGDALRIKQILINFCNNSIKFTEKGFVNINITPLNITKQEANLKFAVQDTGIGISEENQKKLFKEFSQVDASTTRKFGGTGLGLSISKKLTELMGGEIGLESEEGDGSTFWFTGNYTIEESIDIIEPKVNEDNTPIKKLKILLVDDNPINLKVAMHTIKRDGHQVETANDGLEAIDKFNSSNFDLILMDIQMPNMNGYDATKLIREIEKKENKKPIKIIAMTANALKGEKEKCISIGMDAYLSKPFKQEDLIKILRYSN